MPKLSIIIPIYNNDALIPYTLDSILNQSFNDYEIIIVDDGSTDNTQYVIHNYKKRFSNIHYQYQKNSGGCSSPRNTGIDVANGKYIAIFDSDDIMEKHKLKEQVQFLDNNDINFAFTDFCNFFYDHIYMPHTFSCHEFRHILNAKNNDYHIINKDIAYSILINENFIGASSIMFKRELINKIGYFDTSLTSCEDIDFFFRVTNVCNIGFIDKIGHYRRLHNFNMTDNHYKMITNAIHAREKQINVAKNKDKTRLIKKIASLYYSLSFYYRMQSKYGNSCKTLLSAIRKHPSNTSLHKSLLKSLFLLLRSYLH